MTEYQRKIIQIIIITLTLIILCSNVMASQIGCQRFTDNVLECHNNGTIENTTYIHRDLLQMANLPERVKWADLGGGIWWNISSGKETLSFYDMDFETSMQSDNTTYWEVYGAAYDEPINEHLNIDVKYSAQQLLNDDYVNLTVNIRTDNGPWHIWNRPFHLYRSMKNINIDLDNDTDKVRFESYNQEVILDLTGNTSVYRLSSPLVWVYDPDTGHNINWHWKPKYQNTTDPNTYYLQVQNGDLYFWKQHNKSIQANKVYTISHYWIDDEVDSNWHNAETGWLEWYSLGGNITISKSVNPSIGRTAVGFQYKSKRGQANFRRSDFILPDGYIATKVEFRHDQLSSSTPPPPTTWRTDFYIDDCGQYLGTEDWNCGTFAIRMATRSWPEDWWVDLGNPGIDLINDLTSDYWMVQMRDSSLYTGNPSFAYTIWKGKLRINYRRPQVVQSTPPDNKQQTGHFVNLACNWTQIQPDNISVFLWHQTEPYWNATNSSGENISITTPELHDHHLWRWNCYLCKNHNCTWSDNGNWSFTIAFGPDTYFNLTKPENATIITIENNTVNLSCDIWGDIHDETQNISFYVNNTLVNTTQIEHHVWYEHTFNTTGIYEWDCLFCLEQYPPPGYNCRWSDNGNWTIIADLAPIEEDDFIPIIVLMCMAGMLIYRRKGRKLIKEYINI